MENPQLISLITGLFGLSGIIIGAILSFLFQRSITKQIIKADIQKIHTQIQTEYLYGNKKEWVNHIRNIISDLLTETNPEKNNTYNKDRILLLSNQIRLFIDQTDPGESEIIENINNLISVSNDWYNELTECEHFNAWEERKEHFELKNYPGQIFQIQGMIINRTRLLINKYLNIN